MRMKHISMVCQTTSSSDTDSGLSSSRSNRETYSKDSKIFPPEHLDQLNVTRRTAVLNSIPTTMKASILSDNAELKNSVTQNSAIIPCLHVKHRKDAILKKRNNHRCNTIAVNFIGRAKDEPEIMTKFAKSNTNIDSVGYVFDIPSFNNRSMPGM